MDSGWEFSSMLSGLWALAAFIIWALDFYYIGHQSQLFFSSSNEKSGTASGVSIFRFFLFIVGMVAFIFLGSALMRPRKPAGMSRSPIEIKDIFFVLDTSRSMSAVDFRPNRLEAAKQKMNEFVDMMPTDRIGLVIFSERVFTLLPLTTDLNLLKKQLNDVRMDGPLGGGTNIGDAVAVASARLANSPSKEKIVILLTDGVSQTGNLTPLQAAEEALKLGVKIYTIGVGLNEAKMPVGQTPFGTRYQTIPGGSIDFEVLEKMSALTRGKSYRAGDQKSLSAVFDDIAALEKTTIQKEREILFEELYYPYLVIFFGLFFLVEALRRFVLREGFA